MSEANKYKIDEAQAALLKDKVEALRSGITEKAYHLVHLVMPARVLELSELYNKTPDISAELEKLHQSLDPITPSSEVGQGDPKKRKTTGGEAVEADGKVIPSNKTIVEMIVVVKKNILQLIEAINCVKIEDGNNFGVSIQEETVGELGRAEDSGYALLENLSKYFVARAKLVSKVMNIFLVFIRYPTIEDYKKSVEELDEKEYLNLKLSCLDLRNNYAILYDMITKNMDKIRAPRPTSHLNSMF